MKAAIFTKYGPPEVIHLQEVEKPTPKNNEILVKVHAASITAVDSTFRSGKPYFSRLYSGLTGPKNQILGSELAGVVEAVGQEVSSFRVGDPVLATTRGADAHAQYVCLPEDGAVVHKPANLSFAEAAAVPGSALTALPFLRDHGRIQSGDRVLIIGASGNVGMMAVQIAKYSSAQVTGVCSTAKMDLVKGLGADKVIDYTKEDYTAGDQIYDIIFDAGGKSSYARCKNALADEGIFLTTVPSPGVLMQMARASLSGGRKKAIVAFTGMRSDSDKKQDLLFLNGLIENEQLRAAVDRCYPLSEAAAAHRYVENGGKKGGVLLTIAKA